MAESSGGVKFDKDKPRVELISTIATIKKARVYGFGAEKYEINNWRKGIAWSRVIGACLRHILAWIGGENKDPETGLSHLAHAACCLDFLLEFEDTHPEFDDRYKTDVSTDPDAAHKCVFIGKPSLCNICGRHDY